MKRRAGEKSQRWGPWACSQEAPRRSLLLSWRSVEQGEGGRRGRQGLGHEGLAGKRNAQRSPVKTVQSASIPHPHSPTTGWREIWAWPGLERGTKAGPPAVALTADTDLSKSAEIQVQSAKAVARDQGPKGAGQRQRREQGPSLCVPADKGRKQPESVTPGPQPWG